MKKLLLLIFTLFLFFGCYYIYKITDKDEVNYVVVGDIVVDSPYLNTYINNFVDRDLRIVDLIKIIKYNEEIHIEDKDISIHQQLKKADILILSIGMNDLYYKLKDDTKDKYYYVNKMINDLEELFDLIQRYDYKKIIFLGYYNIYNKDDTLFDYLNSKVSKITLNRDICFVNTDIIINKDSNLLKNRDNFILNNNGYEKIYKFLVEKIKNC